MSTSLPGAMASLHARVREERAKLLRRAFPCPAFADDPVGFCRDVLRFEPWDKQAEWIASLATENAAVSITSGHKVGKTTGAAAACLWYWGTRRKARVVLMAPKLEHIKIAIWKELRQLYLSAGRCADCVARINAEPTKTHAPCDKCSPLGDPSWISEDPGNGLKSPDGREIFAYASRKADAIGGISGPEMFFVFDEASGVEESVFEAMKGNEAGGVRKLLLGNPLRTRGEFFESHHKNKGMYTYTARISSEDTPNAKSGEKLHPGLAERFWIEQRATEWGRDSALFKVRVTGEFPKAEAGQITPFDTLVAALDRWESATGIGRLEVGVDVAFTGDDAAIAVRRGAKIFEVASHNGIDEYVLADLVIAAVRANLRERDQKPIVRYDSNGPGARFHKAIRVFSDEIEIVPVNGTRRPNDPKQYHQLRDEIAIGFARWLRYGAIPKNGKLEGEILALKKYDDGGRRARVTSNDELKKKENLGRSPDRLNACQLAVYEGSASTAEFAGEDDEAPAGKVDSYAAGAISPYGGAIDPYGGR